jgi:hypothetical protein
MTLTCLKIERAPTVNLADRPRCECIRGVHHPRYTPPGEISLAKVVGQVCVRFFHVSGFNRKQTVLLEVFEIKSGRPFPRRLMCRGCSEVSGNVSQNLSWHLFQDSRAGTSWQFRGECLWLQVQCIFASRGFCESTGISASLFFILFAGSRLKFGVWRNSARIRGGPYLGVVQLNLFWKPVRGRPWQKSSQTLP